ncbi:hypothetical protein CDV31_011530 [Fusarium ambrosium]|uniref:acylphosphatase n=1 Tax=Fusarium ambrosium TaxID=131363 RepID=A0A428TG72_9HYPO|nr:hypothetical protein CDV31_011530 [Fusarium ambrosium]
MTKRVYFVVHGTVQGMLCPVSFQRSQLTSPRCRLPVLKLLYFTRKKAQEYGVTGWCRNTRDNTVEGEAQATEDILTKFLKDVDYGPRHARVTKVVKEDREIVEGEDSFDVTR